MAKIIHPGTENMTDDDRVEKAIELLRGTLKENTETEIEACRQEVLRLLEGCEI